MSRIQLANYFKQQCFDAIGINPQRLGGVVSAQTATGVVQAMQQSYAQTEMYFVQHSDHLMPRVHQMRTDLAQFYYSTNPSVRLQYISSEAEKVNFTINGTGQVGLNTPQVLTSGDFYAEPQIRIYQDTKLVSGDGEINLSSGVNNGSKALTLGDGAQTGKIFLGGLQVRHLEVGAGNFDLELNGSMHLATNMTDPTEFLNTGNLTLYGQGSSFFGGVEALGVANTFIAGCVAVSYTHLTLPTKA